MKRCPTCNRTFTDDALSFCLDDGAPLLTISDVPSSFDPGATMRYTEARDTASPPEVYRSGASPAPGNQIITCYAKDSTGNESYEVFHYSIGP